MRNPHVIAWLRFRGVWGRRECCLRRQGDERQGCWAARAAVGHRLHRRGSDGALWESVNAGIWTSCNEWALRSVSAVNWSGRDFVCFMCVCTLWVCISIRVIFRVETGVFWCVLGVVSRHLSLMGHQSLRLIHWICHPFSILWPRFS